jgi:hypothetical protein
VAALSLWENVATINCGAHSGSGENGTTYRIWTR